MGWHVLAALRVHRLDPRGGVPRNGQPCRETQLAGFDTADRQLSQNLRTAVGGLDGAPLKVGPDGTQLPEAPPDMSAGRIARRQPVNGARKPFPVKPIDELQIARAIRAAT